MGTKLSKVKKRRRTARLAADGGAYTMPVCAPVLPDPPELDLSPDLVRRREIVGAWCRAMAFEYWLRTRLRKKGSTIKGAPALIELLWVLVEAELVCRVQYPDEYEATAGPEDDAIEPPLLLADPEIVSEWEVLRGRLHPLRQYREDRKKYILPGCQAHLAGLVDEPCLLLRAAGDRYCPAHAQEVREIIIARRRGDEVEVPAPIEEPIRLRKRRRTGRGVVAA